MRLRSPSTRGQTAWRTSPPPLASATVVAGVALLLLAGACRGSVHVADGPSGVVIAAGDRTCASDAECTTTLVQCSRCAGACVGVRVDRAGGYAGKLGCDRFAGPACNYDCLRHEHPSCVGGICESLPSDEGRHATGTASPTVPACTSADVANAAPSPPPEPLSIPEAHLRVELGHELDAPIRRVILAHRAELLACMSQRQSGSTAEERPSSVSIEARIEADGRVSHVLVRSTPSALDPCARDCMVRTFRSAAFPQHPTGAVDVVYPLLVDADARSRALE